MGSPQEKYLQPPPRSFFVVVLLWRLLLLYPFVNNSSVSPNSSSSRHGKKEPNCILIRTPWNPKDANAGNNLTRYVPTNAASNRIKNALQKDSVTKNVRVAGVEVEHD